MKRLGKGMGAYSYSQAVTVGIQLLGLPIFLHFWTMEQYGIWLMLSAIPVYFSMSDLGIVDVAGNKMTMAIAQDDLREANQVFQSALKMTMCTIFGVMILALIVIQLFLGSFIAQQEYLNVLSILIIATLLGLFTNAANIVFRSNNQYAKGTSLVATLHLVEWIFTITAVYLYHDFIYAAVGYLIGRCLMTAINIWLALQGHPHIVWSLKNASWQVIKEMLKPAFSFMAMPVSLAVSLQGMTLIVGTILGPATVVFFNSYRTLSRFLIQGAMVINRPLWPEFSRLFGLGLFKDLLRYYYLSLAITIVGMGLGFVFLYFASDYIFQVWTDGKVTIEGHAYLILVLVACLAGISQVATTVLSATNLHTTFFPIVLLTAIVSVGIAYLTTARFELVGIASIMVLAEVFLLCLSMLFVYKEINRKRIIGAEYE